MSDARIRLQNYRAKKPNPKRLRHAQKENLFKHEALAGGKTTVLRNIITKIKANGVNLSGVITHDPLIEMHHALYENTTNHAYGDKAIRFEFARKDPTDMIALKAIFRNLLKTVANHGRIDMTKKDVSELPPLLHDEIRRAWQKQKERVWRNYMQRSTSWREIFTLFREHCRIGSDELDKVCDPEKEHNYATGEKGELDPLRKTLPLKWSNG